jgi:hypothetical protein
MQELFKAHGRLLPISEGSVRPLSKVNNEQQAEELQLKAWDIACTMRQRSTPTEADVIRAVRQLMTPKVDESTDIAFQYYRRHANRIRTELARMTTHLGDLAAFFDCDDKNTGRQKRDMAKTLKTLATSFDKQHLLFAGQPIPDNELTVKVGNLLALLKANTIEDERIFEQILEELGRHTGCVVVKSAAFSGV